MEGHPGDQLASEERGVAIPFRLGQVSLEDRLGRPLSEVGLEHRGKSEPATGPSAARPVSRRRHRPAR